WDLDRTGIYVAVNFIGLLDELALFNRPLTAEEVARLHSAPGLLAPLKKGAPRGTASLSDLETRSRALPARASSSDPAVRALRAAWPGFRAAREGRGAAGACLGLLLRLPVQGKAPPAPRFPFSPAEAKRYQQASADWAGLPVEVVNGAGLPLVL